MAYTQERVLEKFKEVHGNKYDYSEVEFKTVKHSVFISCPVHNHKWLTTPSDHFSGKGCKFCGYDSMTSRSRMTQEDFVSKSREKHSDVFDYTKVEYLNARTNVTLICKRHDLEFQTQPHVHLKSKFSCPACESEFKGKNKTKNNTAKFVEQAKQKYGDKYKYDRFEFVTGLAVATVTCATHGDFSVRPTHHMRGKGGCKLCGIESKNAAQRSTQEKFIEKAAAIHGNSNYDYSFVEYKNNSSKVKIKCKEHGIFSQRASKHLEGSGCPDCAQTGFSVSKNATLYVLLSENITKIGITNLPVRVRKNAVSSDSGMSFEIVNEFNFKDGQHCTDIETTLLRELREKYLSPEVKFDGYTECFYEVDHAELYARIQELTKEYNE